MLSKINRLRKNQFNAIPGKIFRINSEPVNILYKKTKDSKPRFAVIVPKKISPKSTRRNQMKRQIFIILSKFLNNLNISIYGILKVNRVFDKDNQNLENTILQAINKINENNR